MATIDKQIFQKAERGLKILRNGALRAPCVVDRNGGQTALRAIDMNSGHDALIGPPSKNSDHGLLWRMRDVIESWDCNVVNDDVDNMTVLDLDELFNSSFNEDYKQSLHRDDQNQLVSRMFKLQLGRAEISEAGANFEDEALPVDIMNYLVLVSAKLEADIIPNLYRNNELNPMSNWLTYLVLNHRMRSTFDFELAVNRELDESSSGKLVWDYRLLDLIGGRGTSADSIFELKKLGGMKGLKRQFHCYKKGSEKSFKFPKLDDLAGTMNELTLKCQISDASPVLKFRIAEDERGSFVTGLIGKKENTPVPVKVISKPTKVGRTSPKMNSKASRRTKLTLKPTVVGNFHKDYCGGGRDEEATTKNETYLAKDREEDDKLVEMNGGLVDSTAIKTPIRRRKKADGSNSTQTPETILKFVIRTPRREGFVKVPLDGTTEYVDGIDRSEFEKANVSAVGGQQLTNSRQQKGDSPAQDPKQSKSLG